MKIRGSVVGTNMSPERIAGRLSGGESTSLTDYCKKKPEYTATPETLVDVISKAEAGATIQLETGNYSLLTLTGREGLKRTSLAGSVTTYPENLTIIGGDDVTISGISITSGVLHGDVNNYADTDNAVLPKGLTLKNLTFNKTLSLRNSSIENLRIENCQFEDGAKIILLPNTMSDEHGNDYSTNTDVPIFNTRQNQQVLHLKNLVVKNCTLTRVTGDRATAILVRGVDGASIDDNLIDTAPWNGIQVSGEPTHGIYNLGTISITGNYIYDTGDVSIRLDCMDGAELYAVFNYSWRANLNEEEEAVIYASNCKNTIQQYSDSNRYHTVPITVDDKIKVENSYTPYRAYPATRPKLTGVDLDDYRGEDKVGTYWCDSNNTNAPFDSFYYLEVNGNYQRATRYKKDSNLNLLSPHIKVRFYVDDGSGAKWTDWSYSYNDSGYGGVLAQYASEVDSDGTKFEEQLNSLLSTMAVGEAKQIRWMDYPHLDGRWYIGTLFKSRSNEAVLTGRSFYSSEVIKSYLDGVWRPFEWVNPPLAIGVEYRTTERYDSKVVYTMLVDCGAWTNGKLVTTDMGIAVAPLCFFCTAGTHCLPKINAYVDVSQMGNGLSIQIRDVNGEVPQGSTTKVLVKYTKGV